MIPHRCLQCLSMIAVVFSTTSMATAHGSLSHPTSRIYNAFLEGPENPISDAVTDLVAIGGTQPLYDWNEVVNFHPGDADFQRTIDYTQTIPDGQLASAGNPKYAGLDQVRADWPATSMSPGPNELVWYATTPHDPNVFRLWMTTPDWDPSMPLTWSFMEEIPIGPVSLQDNEYRFNTIIPHRTGRHVMLVIWQRLDPVGEGFYAAADVDFGQTPPQGDCAADFDADGQVTISDLLLIIDAWGSTDSQLDLDQSGLVDVGDLFIMLEDWGTCGPDCDGDGISDANEIADGALDCDADGIPDQCQDTQDCDGNGIPDICDVIDGTHEDCNLNLIPDVCDMADGDSDGNGVLDDCQFDGLSYSFNINNSWSGGFQGELTIHNDEPECVIGWELLFDVPYSVDQAWNGVLVSQIGTQVRIINETWNPRICSGQSVSIGFIATGASSTPTNITINGNPVAPAP